ncbi:MAG: NMD3-related protein [Candidatus Aenigmatarchaeota archaeon]
MKLSKFCPLCGKEVKKLYENLCKKCFEEKQKDYIKINNLVNIKHCVLCNSFYFENEKEKLNSLEMALSKFIERIKRSYFNAELIIENGKFFCRVEKKVKGVKLSRVFELKIKLKNIKCEDCVKRMVGKGLSILQIRSEKWSEILDFLNKLVNNSFFVTEYYQNGFDVGFIKEEDLFKISNLLIGRFELKRKLTKKLIGLKKGKKIFRTTILLSDKNRL